MVSLRVTASLIEVELKKKQKTAVSIQDKTDRMTDATIRHSQIWIFSFD